MALPDELGRVVAEAVPVVEGAVVGTVAVDGDDATDGDGAGDAQAPNVRATIASVPANAA
ncbi:MAG TPA: hypothetical protein VH720_09995 [Candidatus Limnocylindrales bacterium]